MNKVMGAIAAAVLALTFIPAPAQANSVLAERCNNGGGPYVSPNGNRAVQVCISVITDDASPPSYWGRIRFTSVAGYSDPYKVAGDVLFWNQSRYPSGWCDGNVAHCTGGGDDLNDSSLSIPVNFSSSSMAPSQHYDQVHTEGNFTITWNQGGSTESHDFNSNQVYTEPDCHAYNSDDARFYCSF